jgi:hypothetical protein
MNDKELTHHFHLLARRVTRVEQELWPHTIVPEAAAPTGSHASALAEKIVTAFEGHFREWMMPGEHGEAVDLVAEIVRADQAAAPASPALAEPATEGAAATDDEIHNGSSALLDRGGYGSIASPGSFRCGFQDGVRWSEKRLHPQLKSLRSQLAGTQRETAEAFDDASKYEEEAKSLTAQLKEAEAKLAEATSSRGKSGVLLLDFCATDEEIKFLHKIRPQLQPDAPIKFTDITGVLVREREQAVARERMEIKALFENDANRLSEAADTLEHLHHWHVTPTGLRKLAQRLTQPANRSAEDSNA